MRVAYVTSRFPYGVGEAFLIAEIQALTRSVELFVVPMTIDVRDPIHPHTAQHVIGVPLVSVDIVLGALAELVKHPLRTARVAAQVLWADRRWKIQLKNLAVIPKGLWLAGKLRSWRIDHVHAHWSSTSATLAWVAAAASGIPWSFTAHRWDLAEANALPRKLQACSFARSISRLGADKMLALVPTARVSVVQMGVSVPSALPAPSAQHALRLFVPANLLPVKGHKYLIEALGLLKDENIVESCVFAGAGPERDRLAQSVEKFQLQGTIKFLGAIPHGEVIGRYEANLVDVVVLPSIVLADGTQEGVPVALMEAMSYSIAVISTKTGAIGELLDGVGLLVEPANPVALADGIRRLTATTTRLEAGAQGRQRVLRNFNADIIASQLIDLMCAAAGAPPS